MATLADINTKVSNLLGVDTNTYSNANRLIDYNLWHQKIFGMIFDAQDEVDADDQRYTDYPSATWSLTTNRDYALSQFQTNNAGLSYSVLKIKEVSVSYNGVTWYRATPMDITENNFVTNPPAGATTANTTTDSYFTKTAPKYDFRNNAIYLYPAANATDVAAGGQMMVEWFRSPVEFTSAELSAGTVSPGIDPTFHMMIAYGVAYEYAAAQQLPQASSLYRELQKYEDMLRRQYSSKQLDRKYQLLADYQDMK